MSNTTLIVVGLFAVVFIAFIAMKTRSGASNISAQEAHELVAQGALLLDVRSPGEFASGHIKGAKNIAVQGLSKRLGELDDKSQMIVVYCRSGHRSGSASNILRKNGYENIHDLGAMSNW